MPPVKLIVAGAGGRGRGYASYAKEHPEKLQVVGVAEPREEGRAYLVREHSIPPEAVFTDWRAMAARPRFADAVIVATQDRMHTEPAIAFLRRGYHTLLEKPMAPTEAECRRIVSVAKKAGVIFAVCHVMRYTAYTRFMKRMVEEGAVGDIVSIQHLEPVGYWHQAHSYVRGAWRNEKLSSSMLLAKSCHDLDWIRYFMGVPCISTASFGSLRHFRKEEKPAGAASRCLDCSVEGTCPYSAKRFYLGMIRRGDKWWPVDVLTTDLTEKGVTAALRDGPYGRCVYSCDNDVVDNQVVIMNFEGGRTACFTMTAFTPMAGRKTRIFGTRGMLDGDGTLISHLDFLTNETKTVDTSATEMSVAGGHGGGDTGLMQAFVAAVANNDHSLVISGPDVTLESHLMVFAAEQSRREGRIVRVKT